MYHKDRMPASSHPLPSEQSAAKNKNRKQRSKARRQFIEGISLAGLLELCYAPTKPIFLLWVVAFLSFFCSIIYHSCLLISLYLHQKAAYSFIQTDQMVIPFPKVTV